MRNINRSEIVKSKEFKQWWGKRKYLKPHISVTDTDKQFRAFMIDKGIKSQIKKDEYWGKHVNRSDKRDIDYFKKVKVKVKKR